MIHPNQEVRSVGAISPQLAKQRKLDKAARAETQIQVEMLRDDLKRLELDWARKEAIRRINSRRP
jgi:hypothetical protein